jgi:hypothetical protein
VTSENGLNQLLVDLREAADKMVEMLAEKAQLSPAECAELAMTLEDRAWAFLMSRGAEDG